MGVHGLAMDDSQAVCSTIAKVSFPYTSRLIVLLLVLGPASACIFNSEVPAGVRISCTDDDQCPENQVCNSILNECIRQKDADRLAPTLGANFSLTPERATAGTTILAEISASESLIDDPEPFFEHGVSRFFFSLLEKREESGVSTQWVFSYVVQGNEGEGAHPIQVILTDAAGNQATALLGTVVFDFTNPKLIANAAEPNPTNLTDPLQVTVEFDEALSEPPELRLRDNADAELGGTITWISGPEPGMAGPHAFQWQAPPGIAEGPQGPRRFSTQPPRGGQSKDHDPRASGLGR
jgi:hypothetical protein